MGECVHPVDSLPGCGGVDRAVVVDVAGAGGVVLAGVFADELHAPTSATTSRNASGVHRFMRGTYLGGSSNGSSRSSRGSSGRPSTRSPTILRWISSVPPRIESDGAVRKSV